VELPKQVRIGVTGTRSGMNEAQRLHLEYFFTDDKVNITELHHGDCVGVDVEVADIAKAHGVRTVCHPPVVDELRAFHESDEFRDPFTYFARNRNIVDETDVLLVVPYQNSWSSKGGTWYTHDYGKSKKKLVIVFYPDGRIVV